MRRAKRFIPTTESLERLTLPATFPFEVAGYYSPIVLDTSDSSGDTAFGFPGMKFGVAVVRPPSHMGIKKITYTFTPSLMNSVDPGETAYDTAIGKYGLMSRVTYTATAGNYTQERVTYSFAAPKDAVTVTISVAAEIWKLGASPPTAFDTMTDSLTLHVESPTVNSFQVSNQTGAGVAAAPFWFGPTTGSPPAPAGGAATHMTFMMAGGSPLALGSVGFWANITNGTRYDLRLGFIQVVDFSIFSSYTDGTARGVSGTNNLDITSDVSSYWYWDYPIRVGKGVTTWVPSSPAVVRDSPKGPAAVTNGTGFLQTSTWHSQFDTHFAVAGGWIPSFPPMDGYPIALSTARWHLDGSAVNTANSGPGAATVATTTSMANWAVGLAAGSGPSPATPPGPNAPWTAPGDGVVKYITYTGNSFTSLGTLASEVSLAVPARPPGGGHAAGSVLLTVPIPEWPIFIAEWPMFVEQTRPTLRKKPSKDGPGRTFLG